MGLDVSGDENGRKLVTRHEGEGGNKGLAQVGCWVE